MEAEPGYWLVATALMYGCALFNCYHVLGARSSPAASISWIWANLAIPVLGVPLYWFLGPGRIKDYHYGPVDLPSGSGDHHHCDRHKPCPQTIIYSRIFSSFGPVFQPLPSRVRLLIDGGKAFDEIFKEISKARSYILVQYYILRSDRLGLELKNLLINKASQGLKVYLLYDHMGSFWLPKQYLNDLRQAGVRTASFLHIFSLRKFFLMNHRNHRKLVVVDGRVSFTGGLNVGEEYAGSKFGKKDTLWRDTQISIKGPTVRQFEAIFLGDWSYATGEDLSPELKLCRKNMSERRRNPPVPTKVNSRQMMLIPSGPYDSTNIGMLLFNQMIHGCQKRLWVSTPYFVPDEALQQGLELAVLRGVDVRILIPKKAEHKLVHWVTLSYAEQVQRTGVKIYLYDKGFVHQKVFLIDDETSFVGTSNFDNRTLYLNFELMVGIFDHQFNKKVEDMLLRDFDDSHEFAPYSDRIIRRLIRLRANGARLLAPLL